MTTQYILNTLSKEEMALVAGGINFGNLIKLGQATREKEAKKIGGKVTKEVEKIEKIGEKVIEKVFVEGCRIVGQAEGVLDGAKAI